MLVGLDGKGELMLLKNKKTGEIGNLVLNINPNRESYSVLSTENGDTVCGNLVLADYDSLSDLNEEWTDYEEQKGNWTIDHMNENYIDDGRYTAPDELERYEELGLKFNTEEEAEKAVEKLKAWKRVKRDLVSLNWQRERDGSFSVWGEFKTGNTLRADVYLDIHSKDLDLLFCPEENI